MKKVLIQYTKLIAAVTVLFVLSSCGKPKDLKFGIIHNVSVKNLSLSGADIEGSVPIENPNGYVIKVKNADVNLLADDRPIAHITQNTPVTLPGKSKGDYTVNVTISLLNKGELLSLMSLFNGKSNLNLDGSANMSSFIFQKKVLVHQTAIQDYLKPVIDKIKPF